MHDICPGNLLRSISHASGPADLDVHWYHQIIIDVFYCMTIVTVAIWYTVLFDFWLTSLNAWIQIMCHTICWRNDWKTLGMSFQVDNSVILQKNARRVCRSGCCITLCLIKTMIKTAVKWKINLVLVLLLQKIWCIAYIEGVVT